MPRHKSREERMIEKEYQKVLKYMQQRLGNEVTFNTDLEKTGLKYLGGKFKGVFPSDKIPKLDNLKPYAILNLDNSSKPGSHWIGVAYDDKTDNVLVYDSFGRKSSKIIPNIYNAFGGRVVDTDYDKEQRIKEDNCGQRSLAWLIIRDKYGSKLAKLV